MTKEPHKLGYARPRREPSEPDETPENPSEMKRGLSYIGLMFVGVAAFNVLVNLRLGLSGPAVLIGLLGIILYFCGRSMKR